MDKNFSYKEIQKIIEDLIHYLKDLYRIWLNQKPEIFVKHAKEYLRVGVIQYRLLVETKFFERLQKAIFGLNINPHIKIKSEPVHSNFYEIDEVSPDIMNSYISLRQGETSTILAQKKIISLNTYENRFVKGFLIRILSAINELAKDLDEYLDNEQIYNVYKEKIEGMKKNIFDQKRKIHKLLSLDLFQEISEEFKVIPTPVIKYDPVYNNIYKLYLEFISYCVPFDIGEFNLQSFDEWLLFELWVFFEIFKQCFQKFGMDFEIKGWFKEEKGRIKLKIGELEEESERSAEINWKNGYSLYYQRSFGFHESDKGIGSYTVSIKPDVVLWNKNNDEILIFDAKKQTSSSLFKEPHDKRTAIAQLHQYKDAIIKFESQEKVVKGVYAIIHRKPQDLPYEYKKFFEDWYRKKYGFGVYVFEIFGKKEGVMDGMEGD